MLILVFGTNTPCVHLSNFMKPSSMQRFTPLLVHYATCTPSVHNRQRLINYYHTSHTEVNQIYYISSRMHLPYFLWTTPMEHQKKATHSSQRTSAILYTILLLLRALQRHFESCTPRMRPAILLLQARVARCFTTCPLCPRGPYRYAEQVQV